MPQSLGMKCSWLLAVSQGHNSLMQSDSLECLTSGSVELMSQYTIVASLKGSSNLGVSPPFQMREK